MSKQTEIFFTQGVFVKYHDHYMSLVVIRLRSKVAIFMSSPSSWYREYVHEILYLGLMLQAKLSMQTKVKRDRQIDNFET